MKEKMENSIISKRMEDCPISLEVSVSILEFCNLQMTYLTHGHDGLLHLLVDLEVGEPWRHHRGAGSDGCSGGSGVGSRSPGRSSEHVWVLLDHAHTVGLDGGPQLDGGLAQLLLGQRADATVGEEGVGLGRCQGQDGAQSLEAGHRLIF